jgi:hypothetical protein
MASQSESRMTAEPDTSTPQPPAVLVYGREPQSRLVGWLRRWGRKVGISLLIVAVVLLGIWSGFYWGTLREQHAVSAMGGRVQSVNPTFLIGYPASRLPGVLGAATVRIDEIWMTQLLAGDVDQLKKLKWLKWINVTGTAVHPLGLSRLNELEQLKGLQFRDTNVTADELAELKSATTLDTLILGGTTVTDAELAGAKQLKGLTFLGLRWTSVTGSGLLHLKDLPNLSSLDLYCSPITNENLATLKQFKKLAWLRLSQTHITDAGITHLKELHGLTYLDLEDTQLSTDGLAQLKQALPHTQIRAGTLGAATSISQ